MPVRGPDESHDDFIQRCMSDGEMNSEFPDSKQRYAVCNSYAEGSVEKSQEAVSEDMGGCGCECECSKVEADEEAGYPPNCNEGYMVSEDGKSCVPKAQAEICDDVCPPGTELVAGVCVSVTCEVEIGEISAVVEAATGQTVIRITGVAFTSGYNKNNWRVTRGVADLVAEQMVGSDLTLNHPEQDPIGFSRNMDGGVDQAVVGIVREARVEYDPEGENYSVGFVADVFRKELFASLESGLWLREDYGVSIGGTGVPTEIIESEEGPRMLTFGGDFQFDHLAIVHKPAYEGARIDTAERVELEAEDDPPLIYRSHDDSIQRNSEASTMTASEIETEPVENTIVDEVEGLQADLVIANATIAGFEAEKAEKVEEDRLGLVEKATDLGLEGVEDFSAEMLDKVISSWEAAQPEPKELIEATPASQESVEAEPVVAAESQVVVGNFLNGTWVESSEDAYRIAYNAWAKAWNGTLQGPDEANDRAAYYDEIKEMI